MTRKLKQTEIEKRLRIAEAFGEDDSLTYAAAKARFKTSSRVVASALSRAPDSVAIEHVRDLLTGKKGADVTKYGRDAVYFLEAPPRYSSF